MSAGLFIDYRREVEIKKFEKYSEVLRYAENT